MKTMKIILPLLLTVLLGGCTAIEVLAPPVDELFLSEAEVAQSRVAELRAGRQVFMDFCSRCHRPPQVDKITEHNWNNHLPKMFKKAELFPEEIDVLTYYLKTAAPINPALIEKREKS